MIGSLKGVILDKQPAFDKGVGDVLIEVSGVGYTVTVTSNVLSRLSVDVEAFLFIHHHIREADQKLFGFLLKEERVAFEGLLSAHGVGPSLALAVLGTHNVADLARILNEEDLDALCDVPGVGKKTAQRLLVELKSSLVLPVLETSDQDPTVDLRSSDSSADPWSDVRQALDSLGYSQAEIRQAITDMKPNLTGSEDSGELLKTALRSLAGG